MSISTRTRFEILKRDGFRCRYCGASPTAAPLHVDHVIPVAEGGPDDPANLVTSCAPCNLGKSDVPLDERRYDGGGMSADDTREHAEQIRGYLAAQRELVAAQSEVLDEFEGHWLEYLRPNDQIRGIFRVALDVLDVSEIVEAIDVTSDRMCAKGASTQARYFCGVVRNMRRQKYLDRELLAIIRQIEDQGARAGLKTQGDSLVWKGPPLTDALQAMVQPLFENWDAVKKALGGN